MADIRIKDLATTATTTASDDFMAVDGAINGTRKLSAATPAFLTSVTTPSLTSPASTNLTLGTGSFGTALTVASATGDVSIASTTAGSSAAGALVVAGGISAGAASYFGGAVTATGGLTVDGGAAALNTILAAANGYDSAVSIRASNTNRAQINFYSTSAGADKWQLFKASDGTDNLVLYGSTGGFAVTFSQATSAATFANAVSVSGTAATWTSGTGSPESVKTAPVGSLYTRTDGGASTTLYVKESGAGNTGWIAK